ncbi:MAG TPA: hypothetical protein VFX97_17225 [Pyrinomonadaceae bacterium]|nr:hypothetical protein [Pyrinomonadaceae bacterium]
MRATKCPKCKFVGFAEGNLCKRCGQSLDWAPIESAGSKGGSSALVTKAVLAFFLLVGLVVGFFIVRAKVSDYFDPTKAYLAAITNSEKFKEPITIRVNREELTSAPNPGNLSLAKKAGRMVKPAQVLEAAGYLTTSIDKTKLIQKTGTVYVTTVDQYGGARGAHTEDRLAEVESARLEIALTEKGKQEAVNWKETEESYAAGSYWNGKAASQTLPTWRIPIGEREMVGIDSVKPLPWSAEFETVQIKFRWRWRPNQIGEYFDSMSAAFNVLSDSAQQAAASLGIKSQTDYQGEVIMQKRGGRWEISELKFMNGFSSSALGE